MNPENINPEKSSRVKIGTSIIVLLLAVVAIMVFTSFKPAQDENDVREVKTVSSNNAVVEKIQTVPTGFPQDLPIEASNLKEGAVTTFQSNSAKQLSLSYTSAKSVTEKYTEYKNYMTQKGYLLTEGPANSQVRAIFGAKYDANLSIAISSSNKGTLVQISYLIK